MLSRRLLRIKAVKALYAHFQSGAESLDVSEKNLAAALDKTYDLYHQMLWLPVEVMRYAEGRIEAGRKKKLPTPEDLNPNTKFIDNLAIRQLESSEKLLSYLSSRRLGWVQYPELIKNLYNSLTASDYYKAYMDSPERSYKEDVGLVENFFLHEAEDNQMLEDVLEEQSILWSDDLDFSLILAIKTLETTKKGQADVSILPKFKNEDDRAFVTQLFRKTVLNFAEYEKYIDTHTRNWDIERIAFMDKVIMATAIAEIMAFESIPVKVTLDEYIEIAKFYSTGGSSNFVNGILDKVVEDLSAENKIVKTGRGLL